MAIISYSIQFNSNPSRIHFNMLNYSEIQVTKLSAVPEVCKDLMRSLVRRYRVYNIPL